MTTKQYELRYSGAPYGTPYETAGDYQTVRDAAAAVNRELRPGQTATLVYTSTGATRKVWCCDAAGKIYVSYFRPRGHFYA